MNSYQERNLILSRMGFPSYAEYLKSELWASIRRRGFEKYGHDCIRCGNPAYTLHHTNYSEAVLSGETLDGLVPLCEVCHAGIEFTSEKKKRSLASANNLIGLRSSPRKKMAKAKRKHVHAPVDWSICRKCGGHLVKKTPKGKRKVGQEYAYRWYWKCKKCRRMFMVEEAKYMISPEETKIM